MAKIQDYSSQIRGVSYKPEDLHDSLNENSVMLLRANNIDNDSLNTVDVIYVDKSRVSDEQYLKEGDILVCASSGSKNLVGKSAYVKNHINATFGAFCKVIRPKNINSQYLGYYFISPIYRKTISALSAGANINNIRNEHIDLLPICVPELEEQNKIVAILDKVTDLINLRKKEIEKLDLMVKSRFVDMFGMPNECRFELKTLPQIIKSNKNALKRGPFGGALKKDDFVDNGYLVYEQRHAIHNDFEYAKYYIPLEKYQEMIMFKVEPGDLLISCSGVTLGRIAEVPEGAKEGIINQALLKVTLNPDIMLNSYFITLFRNERTQDILFGFSRGSGIPNFPSMSEVKNIGFLCPPIKLQEEYDKFLKKVDKSKYAVKKSLEKLETLKKSLMQKYFD